MILFDGLPVPSTLFYLFAEIFPSRNVRYNLTHYLQCIFFYDVVNVCVSVQTFQDRDSNLLNLLFFENIIP